LVTAHFVDVSSPTSIDLAVTSILRAHGRIDNLVTSAGICENYSAITYPHSRMQKMWSINVDGSFYFATTVAKHLIERKVGGSFVFIGSMSGSVVNVPQLQTPYNMSKAAVRQMARSLAVEWAELGIRVNCVSPGYIKTALLVFPCPSCG
jgi:D-arabinitol 2-dehydrogenase